MADIQEEDRHTTKALKKLARLAAKPQKLEFFTVTTLPMQPFLRVVYFRILAPDPCALQEIRILMDLREWESDDQMRATIKKRIRYQIMDLQERCAGIIKELVEEVKNETD